MNLKIFIFIFHSLSNGEEFITSEQLQRCMRDLVFPSTSDKANSTRYMNGKTHVQKSLTEDSSNQDTPSDDESISEPSIKDRIQNITPGDYLLFITHFIMMCKILINFLI